MFLSLTLLPLVRKRVYELFLKTHQGCALATLWAIWQHTQALPSHNTWVYLLGCIGLFGASSILQLTRMLFRNMGSGKKLTTLKMYPYKGDVVRVVLEPPRPWAIRAGQRVELNIPFISLFSLFQKHPFTISWWENDAAGDADSIFILLRPRSGFTKKLLNRIEPGRGYRAWIDGPFGPASIGIYGLSGEVGDFGHVFMVTTGIGIATQLPYIKELLNGHDKARIRTQRISLVWQLEQEGDWESAQDWLQMLVKQDNGCVSPLDSWQFFSDSITVAQHQCL